MSIPALTQQIVGEIPHLHRYAIALTHDRTRAEDLVQSCLERALSGLHQFRPGTDLRRWLFTILRHIHIDQCRSTKRRGPHVSLEDWHQDGHYPAPQEHYLWLREVERRLGELRDCDRRIVLLNAFSGLSQKAIAKNMNIAVGTVRSRLSRARDQLGA